MNLRHGLAGLAAAFAATVFPARALAAVDAFIWFDSPSMQGETKDKAHPGAFEIKDFSFGVENPTTIGSATSGAGAGKAKFNEFTIKRVVDAASPKFHQAAASGQHFPTVTVEMRKAGGDPSRQYVSYTFSNVFTTKVSWSGPGDEGPEESITFKYGAIKTEYKPQTPGGQQRQTFAPASGLPPPGPGARPPH